MWQLPVGQGRVYRSRKIPRKVSNFTYVVLKTLPWLTKLHIADRDRSQQQLFLSPLNQPALLDGLGITHCLYSLNDPRFHIHLPSFIRPLPAKIAAEDVKYLHCKGALALPGLPLQSALIQAYVEYVHPYMPSMQLHDFVNAVNSTDGLCGQISLFLYHAVMFAASAFVDIEALSEAGYQDRKAARKAFFEKTRVSQPMPGRLSYQRYLQIQ